jgi:hypothetical protein
MEIHKDFEELLALLNANKVDYIIVGSYALAFHGVPRYTGDIDVFVKPDEENARRIMKALNEFGLGDIDISEDDFNNPDMIVQLGVPPVRIDIITSLSGVSWQDVNRGSVNGMLGKVKTNYIGKKDFIANKRAIARTKDLADIEALGEKP